MKVVEFTDNLRRAVINSNLTKDLIMEVFNQLKQNNRLEIIDLKLVKKVDTSALAMLLEFHKHNKIKIINPPNHLLQIANLVEVGFLFE